MSSWKLVWTGQPAKPCRAGSWFESDNQLFQNLAWAVFLHGWFAMLFTRAVIGAHVKLYRQYNSQFAPDMVACMQIICIQYVMSFWSMQIKTSPIFCDYNSLKSTLRKYESLKKSSPVGPILPVSPRGPGAPCGPGELTPFPGSPLGPENEREMCHSSHGFPKLPRAVHHEGQGLTQLAQNVLTMLLECFANVITMALNGSNIVRMFGVSWVGTWFELLCNPLQMTLHLADTFI